MKLLRDDLVILPSKDDTETVNIQDPVSGEVFKFGEVESFFLTEMQKPYQETVLLAKFNAASNSLSARKFSLNEFHDFLATLDECGLLQGGSGNIQNVGNTDDISADERQYSGNHATANELPYEASGSSGQPSDRVDTGKDNTDGVKRYNHWSLFCPEKPLDLLLTVARPFYFLMYVFAVFFLVTIIAFIFKFDLIINEFHTSNSQVGFVEHVLLTLFTISLTSQIVKGFVARCYQLEVPSFGIIFAFGFLPKFSMFVKVSQDAPRNARLWIYASTSISRCMTFSIGVVAWALTHSSGTALSSTGALVAVFSSITLFFTVNPLMNGDGYLFLTVLFNAPKVREKANRALLGIFIKQPKVVSKYIESTLPLKVYAIASFVFLVLFFGYLGLGMAEWLEVNYRGFGVAVFVFIGYLMFRSLYRRKKFKENLKDMARKNQTMPSNEMASSTKTEILNETEISSETDVNLAGSRIRSRYQKDASGIEAVGMNLPGKNVAGSVSISGVKPANEKKRNYLRYIIAGLLLGCLFIPYNYEAGGTVGISPMAYGVINAETAGVVENVFFVGGEWVKENTVVAQISNYRQVKDVRATEASIEEVQEEINTLLTTPSKEELSLAEEQLSTAQLRLKYSTENHQRLEELYKTEVVSLDEYSDAVEEMDLDTQSVIEKEANLQAVINQVNSHNILAKQAEKRRLEEELINNRELLERTNLRMPFDGQIITKDLMNLKNKYLENGDLFAEVEDSSHMRAEIEIPEADIGEIQTGSNVELKLWSYPGDSLYGKISEIYPATTDTTYGTVVKVISIIPNNEKLLKTGMTGQAKVESRRMFLVTAFTRALVNFVTIEMWSWLP